jgi:type III pantothenate kinase
MFETYYNVTPLILGPGVKSGVKLKVDDPKSVGADIICDCAGAMKYSQECLVIDLGTATKYIYVKNNTFLGLSISPGVAISMKALVSSAALLPNIELVSPKNVLGTN